LISSAAQAEETSTGGSEEINQLFSQMKTETMELERDADELALWTKHPHISWQGHAQKLNEMEEDVNRAGKILAELHKARASASPWQQEAIDRVYPMLKEMADDTQSTIEHFSDNKTRINFPPYTDYARANYELARDLAALINDYVDYGNHEAEFLRLQEKLQAAK
jgi:hypothetical protein